MINRVLVRRHILVLIFLSYLFFMLGNGILSLTNPDEVFYAQTAKEMIQRNSWMTPYIFGQPQFEKPIFTYWVLRIGFSIFGISSFSARLFPALFATIGVFAAYFLALVGFKNEKKAFISSIILLSCALYVGLARTVFTDMIFSVFILLALLSFFWGYCLWEHKKPGIYLFFVFSGLAVLTKGPLGLIIPSFTVLLFLIFQRDLRFLVSRITLKGFLIFLLISLPWYIFMLKHYGRSFIQEFFYNDHFRRLIEAEHPKNDKWYFYLITTFACMFPWSLYLVAALLKTWRDLKQKTNTFQVFLISWVLVVFFIFQFAHSKLISYIFPLFPALAIIIGSFLHQKSEIKGRSPVFFWISLATLLTFILIPLILVMGFKSYLAYFTFQASTYYFAALFLAVILLALLFIIKNKNLNVIYSFGSMIPLILLACLSMSNYIEPYVSSKKACEYLLKDYKVNNVILCSNAFVRGVKYYSNKEVAIMDLSGKPFFSPHPILNLSSGEALGKFLKEQSVTYCVLKDSSLEDVLRITANNFKRTVLKKTGVANILMIEQLVNEKQILPSKV